MSSVISKNSKAPDSDEIEFGSLVGALLDHKKLIISVVTFFTFLSIIYVLFSTPVYQADALVQVEQNQGNAILQSLSQVMPETQPQSEPEIALLQSRMILGQTVDDLNLQAIVSQKYFPLFGRGWARLIGEQSGQIKVGHLFIKEADNDKQEVTLTVVDKQKFRVTGKSFELIGQVGVLLENPNISILVKEIAAEPGTEFTVEYQTRLTAINALQKILLVADQGKDTGMLTLTLMGEDSTKIAEILDSITKNYLGQNIARQAAQDAKSLEFLQNQLPKVRTDLDNAEDKLNIYRRQKDSIDLSLEAKSILDQIVNVDNQLNQLTFREAEVSQLYTKEHPVYKALLEKRQTLQDERSRLSKQVSSMPSTQQEIIKLSRDVESGRAVYMQLLNRQQELEIAKSSAIGNVRIIDHAVTQPIPVKPKKILIVIISFILGGIISVGLVLAKAFFHRGIESPEQLENQGISVYASVPISTWLIKTKTEKNKRSKKIKHTRHAAGKFLALDNPTDLAIEAIRSLRTSLHFAMLGASNNIIMISGPNPDAGKTFISTNLAAVMAQADKKVLLIDADMRKGYSHKTLGLENNIGLSEVITRGLSIDDVVKTVPKANFDFIGRGAVVPNPAELLMHRHFSELINNVSKSYDLVIIDTPPILAVTDAAIIGRYVGTSLLVARFEESTLKEVEISVRRFEQAGVKINGCILNGVVKKASNYYNYGYNFYGYDYTDKKST